MNPFKISRAIKSALEAPHYDEIYDKGKSELNIAKAQKDMDDLMIAQQIRYLEENRATLSAEAIAAIEEQIAEHEENSLETYKEEALLAKLHMVEGILGTLLVLAFIVFCIYMFFGNH